MSLHMQSAVAAGGKLDLEALFPWSLVSKCSNKTAGMAVIAKCASSLSGSVLGVSYVISFKPPTAVLQLVLSSLRGNQS